MKEKTRERMRGSIRAEVVALAILVPVVIIAGVLLVRWSGQPAEIAAPSTQPSPLVAAATPTPTPGADENFSSPLSASSTPQVEQKLAPAANQIQLVITNPSEQKEYQLSSQGLRTVAEVLTRAQAEQNITVETKDYGGSLGLFVESINGLRNNVDANMYWHLYVNGARSPVGASNATVQATDTILWKYETENGEDGQ